jgi:hypothetical protein
MIYAIAGLNILGILSILIENTERHAAQAPALRERYQKSSIFNLQFRLVRIGCHGGGRAS